MRIIEYKIEELTGGWRKFDEGKLHNLGSYFQRLNQGRCDGEAMWYTQEFEEYIQAFSQKI